MTIQDKMDSANIYADYEEFAEDLIDYVDEEFESVSVIADATTVLNVLLGLTEYISPIFGYVSVESELTNMFYRLTLDENYVVDIEPIGNGEIGYRMGVLADYTLCSANVPLSVCKFLDSVDVAFEIFDIVEDFEDCDEDCENCEYAIPLDEIEYACDGIEFAEPVELVCEPDANITIDVHGDVYINYPTDYNI